MTRCVEQVEIQIYHDGRMDTRSASGYLGLSVKTLAMMRCRGSGPRFIKRGRIFYFKEDLDGWIQEAKRVTSTTQARLRSSEEPRCTEGRSIRRRGRVSAKREASIRVGPRPF